MDNTKKSMWLDIVLFIILILILLCVNVFIGYIVYTTWIAEYWYRGGPAISIEEKVVVFVVGISALIGSIWLGYKMFRGIRRMG